MIIRSEQMKAMARHAEEAFEDEMAKHIREFAPARARFAGPDRLKLFVHEGILRAKAHGFTWRGPLRLYLDLMILFGSDFDSDPQYPWAVESLKARNIGGEMQRAGQLHERAIAALDEFAGPRRDLLAPGLQRIARAPSDFAFPHDMQQAILRTMSAAYPEKAEYVSAAALRALFRKASDEAVRLKIDGPQGIALLTFLMFAAGHGVVRDPLYSGQIDPRNLKRSADKLIESVAADSSSPRARAA